MVAMSTETKRRPGSYGSCPVASRHQVRCRRHPGRDRIRHYGVSRYYDPGTGQFLSVDPMVAQNDDAYVYGSDNPIENTDPTGKWVVGPCGGAVLFLGGAISGDICLARTVDQSWDDIGFTKTVGFGWGSPGSSIYLGVLFSSAQRIGDLGGYFDVISASISVASLMVGASVFWGNSPLTGQFVDGVEIQLGLSTPWPTVEYGYTYTWTTVIRQGWLANPLRWAWDGLMGQVPAPLDTPHFWLNLADRVSRGLQVL